VIISGGKNVSSIEIEDVLHRHPAVTLAAVVAAPNEKWGEVPCAFVELRASESVTADELSAFCRERLAAFKTPKHFVFGEIPRTSTGKAQKFLLRSAAKRLLPR
jgi:fatty-acyl-CoA synthase